MGTVCTVTCIVIEVHAHLCCLLQKAALTTERHLSSIRRCIWFSYSFLKVNLTALARRLHSLPLFVTAQRLLSLVTASSQCERSHRCGTERICELRYWLWPADCVYVCFMCRCLSLCTVNVARYNYQGVQGKDVRFEKVAMQTWNSVPSVCHCWLQLYSVLQLCLLTL